MKPILLVVACIILLVWVIYQNRERLKYANTQTTSSHLKIMKDSHEFLPNEGRMCNLMY